MIYLYSCTHITFTCVADPHYILLLLSYYNAGSIFIIEYGRGSDGDQDYM